MVCWLSRDAFELPSDIVRLISGPGISGYSSSSNMSSTFIPVASEKLIIIPFVSEAAFLDQNEILNILESNSAAGVFPQFT